MRRILPLSLLALLSLTGCAGVGGYFQDRGRDALQILDLGVTWSGRPSFAAFLDCPLPLGYSHIDGHFAGLRAGDVAATPYHQHAYGLLVWGRESAAFCKENSEQALADPPKSEAGRLASSHDTGASVCCSTSCLNTIHIGFLGLAFEDHPLQLLDFALGWFGVDIDKDDGGGMRARG